jgi:iron complex outermembrane receptor protein
VTALETITVSATRLEATVGDVPSSISVISEAALQEQLSLSGNIDQALERVVPGLGVAFSGLASSGATGNGPQLRGRPATVLLNGVPVNTLLRSNGIDTSLIDANAIGQAEVKRGATAAFGFGAPGGVLQFLTRRGESEDVSVNARLGYSFYDEEAGDGSIEAYSGLGQKTSAGNDYYFGVGFRNVLDDFGPSGEHLGTGEYKTYNLDGNVGWAIGDNSEIRFTGNYYRRNEDKRFTDGATLSFATDDTFEEYALPPGVRNDTAYEDPLPTSRDARQENYVVTASYAHSNLLGGTFEVLAFIQQNTYRSPFLDSNFEQLPDIEFGAFDQEIDNDRLGVRTTLTADFEFRNKSTLEVAYGVDYIRDRMTRTYISGLGSTDRVDVFVPGYGVTSVGLPQEIQFPLSPPVELEGIAPFAQLAWRAGRWLVTAGARYEESQPRSRGYNDGGFVVPAGNLPDFGQELFNAGLVYDISETVQIFGGFSEGVEITELGRAVRGVAQDAIEADGDVTLQELQAVRLNPSVTTEYELGIRGSRDAFSFAAAAFYNRAPLSARVAAPPGSPPNAILVPVREPTRVWGLEFNGEYRINEAWSVSGLASWQDGELRLEDADSYSQMTYDRISPPRLRLDVDWTPTEAFALNLSATQVFETSDFPDQELSSFGGDGDADVEDGYLVFDAVASLDAGPGQVSLGIANLFDEKYFHPSTQIFRSALSQFREPGRNITLTYAVEF